MILENEMHLQKDFVFGVDYINRNSNYYHTFNPDVVNNFHISISGSSGSGKTRMLKHLIQYLSKKNKHIHVIDVKGDLFIEGENYIDFPIRNQEYGINPFEFDKSTLTGGVKRRSGEIVEMIVKSFSLKIGAAKKDVISRLILDTYKSKGITENESTWGTDLSKEEQAQMLPSIEDLVILLNTILDAVNYGHSNKLEKSMIKFGKEAVKSSAKFSKIEAIRDKVLGTIKSKYVKETEELLLEHPEKDFEITQLDFAERDPEYSKVKELECDMASERAIMETAREKFLETASGMFDSYIDSNGETNHSFDNFVNEDEVLREIDLKYYSKKNVVEMLEGVSVYFNMLLNSGLFNKNIPPVKVGLNRYDISKHNQSAQVFFTEVIAHKLFNVTKLRGDYSSLPLSLREKRGQKNDTFLVIDEAQVVLPDIHDKDKESSTQIFNRIASESRSKGLGLILSSQSLTKFSNVININIPNKIIFRTLGTDINATKKMINMQDKKDKSFEKLNATFGIGLYINESQEKKLFLSPWYDDSTQARKL